MSNQRMPFASVTVAICWLLVGCSAPDESCVSRRVQALIGGTADAGTLGVPANVTTAVGDATFRSSSVQRCTYTRIAGGWGLTAAHCAGDASGDQALYLEPPSGASDDASPCHTPAVAAVQFVVHPSLDVMLIKLPDSGPEIGQLQVSTNLLVAGDPVLLAGYGLREDGTMGGLEFLAGEITAVSHDSYRVSAGPDKGACVGDSGGPLLGLDDDEQMRVQGVLSQGSPNCRGYDDYIRSDRLLPWIQETVGRQDTAP